MGLDVITVLMCALLWVVHAVRLVQAPLERSWPAFIIVAVGAGITGAGFVLWRAAAAHVAVGAVVMLLIAPTLAVRSASRALRFGRISWARRLSRLALWLRPLPVQRRFQRAVDVSWRLSRGEVIDVEAAIDELDVVRRVDRQVHRVAFLSWTNDFGAMAEGLADPKVHAYALRGGMAAIVTVATGETGSVAELVTLYRKLSKVKALSRRSLDANGTLTALAAYLGDVRAVRDHASNLRRDLPKERIAFMVATAEQRAGETEAAQETITEALRETSMSVSGRRRLLYRREHRLPAISQPEREQAAEVLADVRKRLNARRALSALGFDLSGRASLSWAMTALLALVFIWQSSQSRRAVFEVWGLIAPYADGPDTFRLLSYAMLHVDVGHLVVNVIGLLIFGRFVEQHFGALGWWVIYVLGAIVGGLAFLGFSTTLGVAIGASGAVLALFGATVARIAFDPGLRQSVQGKRELTFLVVIAVGQLVGDLVIAQSSGSAHAGGFVVGFCLGAVLARKSR